MKKYAEGKMKRIALCLLVCTVFMHMHVSCALATEISGSNNEAETTTEVPATEAPATEAPATEAPATEVATTEAPVTEAPVTEAPATEAPVIEAPATEAPASDVVETEELTESVEEVESSDEESSEEESSDEESSSDEETNEEADEDSDMELIETGTETEEETWPMGFSGAGDGETSEEETSETSYAAENKTGAGTVAKVVSGIFMVLLVVGAVAYGYISMTRRQEARRRERRAREWDDWDDDEE